MKKKNRFLINIALLALSLCIMVYGVYSAKQASLTVSGTIGFNAHDISLKITGASVSGALTSAGAKYTDTPTISGTTVTFGALYYDDLTNSTATADKISPILITINMQNNSKFPATVTPVSPAQSAGENTKTNYTIAVSYASGTNMAANGGTCTVTVTLTYTTNTSNAHGTTFSAAAFNISTSVVKA